MKQLMLSIKDTNVPHKVEDILLHNFHEGCRNYTISQVGKATLPRVSDVLTLKCNRIYKTDGDIKKNTHIHDKKAGEPNILYLKLVKQDLIDYFSWLNEQNIQSERLFPSSWDHSWYITEKQFYKTMARTGDLLGIDYLRTHSMRKTGAHRAYVQTHYNTGLVMNLLNHTSGAMISRCPGLDQASREKVLDEVKSD